MRILGIDPGIGRLGWAVIEYQKSNIKDQIFGCIETSKKDTLEKRLLQIHSFLSELLDRENPEVMAVEELFFGTNVTTAFAVGQARGVVLLTAAEHNIPVVTYSPNAVKIGVTGYGKADKNQVGQMVKQILKLPGIPKPDDTTDALAIAITHAYSAKSPKYL